MMMTYMPIASQTQPCPAVESTSLQGSDVVYVWFLKPGLAACKLLGSTVLAESVGKELHEHTRPTLLLPDHATCRHAFSYAHQQG